jgi:DNA-directed RNA polymerase I subunit RPA49
VESQTAISTERYLKHYVAVFDPATGRLDVTEAKKMIVRPQVRQFEKERERDEEAPVPVPQTPVRAALTEAFGTKKSKRLAQSMAENRLLARGDDADDPLSQAILSTMHGDAEEDMDEPPSPQTNKPVPHANLGASKVEDAYALSTLVVPEPGQKTLSKLRLSYWKERIGAGKAVSNPFHFVSNRVQYLVEGHLKSPDSTPLVRHVQVLMYINLLLELHQFIIALPERKPIPNKAQLPEKALATFAKFSEQLLPQLLAHFFPANMRNRYPLTLLRTTILALTLHIPPPSLQAGDNVLVTEPTDISRDLGLEVAEVNKLFRELGCKLMPATDTELARWKLTRMKAPSWDDSGKQVNLPKPRFAKLRLPLEFPKLSLGKRVSSGKRR